MMRAPFFRTKQEYGQCFTDVSFWKPYVELICSRHQLDHNGNICSGLPGTNVVFIVDGTYAVKLYPQLFNGEKSNLMEIALYGLIASAEHIPAPKLIAQGILFPDDIDDNTWHWPYIVTTVVPGTSLGEVIEQISYEDKEKLAVFLGSLLKQIHTLPYESSEQLVRAKFYYYDFLRERYDRCVEDHKKWGSMPYPLIEQIADYLIPFELMVASMDEAAVIHCDLNQDHVLGDFQGDRWVPTGVIDFGDAKIGDRFYELIALHMGLFHVDKKLLRSFIESYGLLNVPHEIFVKRAMCYTLLFEFDVIGEELGSLLSNPEIQTLDDLAALIWDWNE